MRYLALWPAIVGLLFVPFSGRAQVAVPPVQDSLPPAATVSLLTMLPGDEVYSLFGHSAFRIRDPATGLDRTYNYGTFDFEKPGFILRFARGELDYILATAPTDEEVVKYQWLERPIIEQRLDLDSATIAALHRRLEINALPENRAYRYRFFYDNCSTRLLEILDAALVDAGRPRISLPAVEADESFREMIRPYAAGEPLLWTGMSAGLGTPADEVATTRQRSFLPVELMTLFDGSTVEGRPLVATRDTMFWVAGAGTAPHAFPWPTVLGWAMLVGGVVATVAAGGASWWRVIDVLLLAASGGAGVVFALLWLATSHGVTGPNMHLLWAWPTHLVAAVALARSHTWRPYLLAAGAAAFIVAAGWASWPQGMPAALLPVVLLVAARCVARARAGSAPGPVAPA